MRSSGGARFSSTSNRPGAAEAHPLAWRLVWLATGMVFGGVLQQTARLLLPGGAVKGLLASGIGWQSAAVATLHLGIGRVSVGPLALDVSIIAVVGMVGTYLLLRSIFAR
jgi:hypothetical protein